MKKILILTFIILNLLSLYSFAFFERFQKDKSCVFLSHVPYNQKRGFDEKIPTYEIFKTGEKIYFMVYSDKGFKSSYIKYQVIKQDDNAHMGGFSRIYNTNLRVSDSHFHSDYFILNKSGKYYIQVFDIENLHQWIAIAGFKVVDD